MTFTLVRLVLAFWCVLSLISITHGGRLSCAKCVGVSGDEQQCMRQSTDVLCRRRQACSATVTCDNGNTVWTKQCCRRRRSPVYDKPRCNADGTSCKVLCNSDQCNANLTHQFTGHLPCLNEIDPQAAEDDGRNLFYTGGTVGESKYADAGELMPLTPLFHIVGGEVSRAHEFPWQVSLRYQGPDFRHICGGAILNHYTVATAAHCVTHDSNVASYRVVVGEHDMRDDDDGQVFHTVDYIIYNSDFSTTTLTDDTAIIRVESPIEFSENVQPVGAPDPTVRYTNMRAVISGWGHTQFRGQVSPVLKDTALATLPNELCQSLYDGFERPVSVTLVDSHMCASDNEGDLTHSSCQGDSGGPLVVKGEDGIFRLVGMVSFGLECAIGLPAAYARMTSFLQWYDERIPMSDRE